MTAATKAPTSEPVRYYGVALGQRYTVPPELWWDDERKPCTVCKGPTNWRRPRKRGAATHPECEGSVFDQASEDLYADVLFSLADAFEVVGMDDIADAPLKPKERVTRPLGNPDAGCSICGRGYAALWIVARLWACPQHSLIPIRYRRSRT
jgi:hypothetical protein